MITISIDFLATFFVLVAIFLVIGFSFFYDFLEERQHSRRCMQSLFYCKKCNCVMSVNDDIELFKCPKCGMKNGRLKF